MKPEDIITIRVFKQELKEIYQFINLYRNNPIIHQGLRLATHTDEDLKRLFDLLNNRIQYLNDLIFELLQKDGYEVDSVKKP